MALFASSRDISMIRRVNKELIKNIISQEIDYYQLALQETDLNVYGEAPAGKTYLSAVRIACLILREDQTWTVDDQFGSNITQTIQLQFNRDMLTEANLISFGVKKFECVKFFLRLALLFKLLDLCCVHMRILLFDNISQV